jgi:hypothetical protein
MSENFNSDEEFDITARGNRRVVSEKSSAKHLKPLTEAEKNVLLHWQTTKNAAEALKLYMPDKFEKYGHKGSAYVVGCLRRRPVSVDFLKDLEIEIEEKTNITKDWVLDELVRLKNLASDNGDYNSAIKSIFLITKIMGYMSKTVIDVKKTVSISFGGGFDPNSPITLPEANNIQFDELKENNTPEMLSLNELPKIEIQDENIDTGRIEDNE